MTIEAKIICDSVSPRGQRIATMQLTYPRFIHAEFMTHRAFSRNASSSRAIPVHKLINSALKNPAFFVHVGANEKGMQASGEVSEEIKALFKREWKELAQIVAGYVNRWSADYGIHKQVANRAMEPWHHITVLVTATDWDNFFSLRDHEAAQPEMRVLAVLMRAMLETSVPQPLKYAEWHLPFITPEDNELPIATKIKASVARCARVSYLNHDGTTPNIDNDLALYERLVGSEPIHASPTEHQAVPARHVNIGTLTGNFHGWFQHRKMIEHRLSIGEFA